MNWFILVITALLLVLINPLVCVFGGWLFGLVISAVCGNWIAGGLSLILGTDIVASQIPLICAILGMVAAFFTHPVQVNSNSK